MEDNKVRGPTRALVRAYYESNRVSLREVAEEFDIKYNTVKSWKARDKATGDDWVQPIEEDATDKKKPVATFQNKTQRVNHAKSMVIAGSTIKEASERVGVNESTLQDYSAKEKWMESRKAYNKHIYESLIDTMGKEHIKDREVAMKMLKNISISTYRDWEKGELFLDKARINKEASKIIADNVLTASKLLGVKDIDRVQFDELLDEFEEVDESNELIIKVVD